jgi:hypothetical protein
MRNCMGSLVVSLMGVVVFSLPAAAQVYIPGDKSPEQQKTAAESKAKLKYDPHDLSGIWQGGRPTVPPPKDPRSGDAAQTWLMGGALAPPLTAWGQKMFDANKPSAILSWQSRRVVPALGNDPLGNCDPLGYPRNLGDPGGAGGGTFEFVQTPDKILQIFEWGRAIREIWTDGRKLPDDLDPRWYGWAVGHWEGDALIVDSKGYDERTWLDANGWPHSEEMKLHEVYGHPDATTLEMTMTLDDPMAYAKTWAGNKQAFRLALPKGLTVMYENYCVPSEEQTFNNGVRNPAGGDLAHSRPLH